MYRIAKRIGHQFGCYVIKIKAYPVGDLKTIAKNVDIPQTSSVRTAVQSKLYARIIKTLDPLVPNKCRVLWEHPAGPKTIFFWAPLVKWGLVIASLKDLNRPADTISTRQSGSLGLSAIIWTRYSLIIVPKNYLLFAVNFFVSLTQGIQTGRGLVYMFNQK